MVLLHPVSEAYNFDGYYDPRLGAAFNRVAEPKHDEKEEEDKKMGPVIGADMSPEGKMRLGALASADLEREVQGLKSMLSDFYHIPKAIDLSIVIAFVAGFLLGNIIQMGFGWASRGGRRRPTGTARPRPRFYFSGGR